MFNTCNGHSLNIASVHFQEATQVETVCPDMFCSDVLNCEGVLGRRAGVEHKEWAPS